MVAPCNLPTPPPPVTSPMIPNDILIQADAAEGVWLDKVYVCKKKNEMNRALGHLCAHIGLTGPGEPPENGEMNEMALSSRHRI